MSAPADAVVRETPREAARRLAAPALRDGHVLEALYCYRDAGGEPLFWRIRCKHPDGRKWIRPMRIDGGRFVLGEPSFPKGRKPLFNLPGLAKADADGPIFVVEGETCVTELVKLGLVATTSGGAASADGADWTPLRGRHVILWPDDDGSGGRYARDVARALRGVATPVELVDVAALNLPEHGDCVDWLATFDPGLDPDPTADTVLALPREPAPEPEPEAEAEAQSSRRAAAPVVRRFADIEREELAWLWPGRFPLGKLALLVGDPGLGKSLVTVALAAAVSMGAHWPIAAEGRAPLGDALLVGAEDDPADTVRPRLEAAGADLRRVHVLDGVEDADADGNRYRRPWTLGDLGALEDVLESLPECKLVAIDPLSAFLGGVDTHRNADVRAVLAPLSELAARHRVAVVAVSHLNKSAGPAGYRVSGSIAFTAAARAAYAVAKDKAAPGRRLMLPIKANLAADATGVAYRVTAPDGVPVVSWEPDPVEADIEDALARETPDGGRTETDEAVGFLRELLAAGPVKAKDVFADAAQAGFSRDQMHRAKRRLGAEAVKDGMTGGWSWVLPPPEDSAKVAKVALSRSPLSSLSSGDAALPSVKSTTGTLGDSLTPEAARYRSASDDGGDDWEAPL